MKKKPCVVGDCPRDAERGSSVCDLRDREHERQRTIDAAMLEMDTTPRETTRVVRELRPCPACGHHRMVPVRYRRNPDRSWREATPRRCGVCEALARARHYERLAVEARQKASDLRARRDRHLQRKLKAC